MLRHLPIAAGAAALLALPALAQDPAEIVLPAPDSPLLPASRSGGVTLELESSAPNKITDDDDWWLKNGLEKPESYVRFPALERGARPDAAPEEYKGEPLMGARQNGDREFYLYGESIYKARYLLVRALDSEEIEFAFDATTFGTVAWAGLEGDTLFLTNNPGNLSAADGGGARLYAVDLKSGKMKWRTEPKTASGQFLVTGGSVICAYGFTGEPDFIYVLDADTGEVSQTVKLKTAADWLIRKGDRLFVRCYNTDNVYRIK